jgi:hypothetical protein
LVGGALKVTLVLAEALFPAASVTTTCTVFVPLLSVKLQLNVPALKVAAAPSHSTLATPEAASLTEPLTASELLETVLPLAGDEMDTNGGVVSTLTKADVWLEFPALSTAVPLTWLTPSFANVTGEGQAATPESESLQEKLTVTAVLFHPAELGAGVATAVMTGGVRSRFKVTVVVALCPAASVAVPLTI